MGFCSTNIFSLHGFANVLDDVLYQDMKLHTFKFKLSI